MCNASVSWYVELKEMGGGEHLGREHYGIVDQEPSVQIEQARQCHKLTPAPVLGSLHGQCCTA